MLDCPGCFLQSEGRMKGREEDNMCCCISLKINEFCFNYEVHLDFMNSFHFTSFMSSHLQSQSESHNPHPIPSHAFIKWNEMKRKHDSSLSLLVTTCSLCFSPKTWTTHSFHVKREWIDGNSVKAVGREFQKGKESSQWVLGTKYIQTEEEDAMVIEHFLLLLLFLLSYNSRCSFDWKIEMAFPS